MAMNTELTKSALRPATKRRNPTNRQKRILCKLYEAGKQSHQNLADSVGLRPTALSNHLLNIDNAFPGVLKREYVKRFCFYSLTETGRRLVEEFLEPEADRSENGRVLLDREDDNLFLEAKNSLEGLDEEKGPLGFNDVLVYYTRGGSNEVDAGVKRLTDRYLWSLERLVLNQNDRLREQTLALLTDKLNRDRVSQFIDDYFLPFAVVLRELRKQEHTFEIIEILRFAFTGRSEAAEKYTQSIGWDSELLKNLQEAAGRIRKRLMNCPTEEICDYFAALLPDERMLGVTIAQWLRND